MIKNTFIDEMVTEIEFDAGDALTTSLTSRLSALAMGIKKRLDMPAYLFTKRLFDIIISTVFLVITFPLMLVLSIIIRVDSPGDSLFRQIRIKKNRRNRSPENGNNERRTGDPSGFPPGLRFNRRETADSAADRRENDLLGEPFTFYKFRTMVHDARERYDELYAYEYSEREIKRLVFKLKNDPRLTRFGRWVRKVSIDEFPNFINVFKGDMTLVGPRPDIPEMTKYYAGHQKIKLDVKPGITGLPQIKGRGNISFQRTLAYDKFYVKNQSFLLDMKILFLTVISTIKKDGAF